MPSAHRLGEAHLAGDVGAAVAARLDQLAGDLAAVLEDVDDGAEPLGEAGASAPVWRSTKRSACGRLPSDDT